jgi:hypothetical protein
MKYFIKKIKKYHKIKGFKLILVEKYTDAKAKKKVLRKIN